jgi:hypothetical protein
MRTLDVAGPEAGGPPVDRGANQVVHE